MTTVDWWLMIRSLSLFLEAVNRDSEATMIDKCPDGQ